MHLDIPNLIVNFRKSQEFRNQLSASRLYYVKLVKDEAVKEANSLLLELTNENPDLPICQSHVDRLEDLTEMLTYLETL